MQVTELTLQAFFKMSGFADVFGTIVSEDVTQARIQELVLLQQHLTLQLDALSSHDHHGQETRLDDGYSHATLKGPRGGGWDLTGGLHTINANAKTVSSLIEYGTNNWSLSRVKCEKLIERSVATAPALTGAGIIKTCGCSVLSRCCPNSHFPPRTPPPSLSLPPPSVATSRV